MLIRRWMTKDPVAVAPTGTLAEARRKMDEGHFRRIPVVEGGRLVGIVTDRDLRQYIGQLEHTRVDAVMTAPVMTARPDMLLDQAARLMLDHKVGGLPVTEGDRVIGIITSTDMLRAFASVLGVAEEGVSRIDLDFAGDSFDLVRIVGLIGLSSGEVLGMGTYDRDRKKPVVYIRVRTEDAKRVANMLTEQGFSVLSIHQ